MSDTLETVCAHCGGVNRLTREKLSGDAAAKCGRCHELLIDTQPQTLGAEAFDKFVGRSDLPVLVDFWATWCGPCQTLGPILKRATPSLAPEIRVAKVDIDQAQALAQRLNIRSVPTLAVFRRGKELARMSGVMAERDLIAWARQAAAQG